MENLAYKNENIQRKYIKICKITNFRFKKQPFRVRKKIYGIKGQRIERQRRKIKKENEREKLFKKLIIVSKDDMGTFGEQEMKKKLK